MEPQVNPPGTDYVASFVVPVFKLHSAVADVKMQTDRTKP